ncbi:hypothetical protein FRB94_010371 [Tulasnella sp. JGI-2019a]|nr:hypothetical protein FRB94_010371 [Tulasnella sp. JGI-2019a]
MSDKVMPRAPLAYTPVEDIQKIHDRLLNGFKSRKSRSIEYRKQQLAQLAYMLQDNHERFEHAFKLDFRRHLIDSHLAELGSTHSAIVGCINNLDEWTQTKPIPFNINAYFMSPKVRKEPKGVVLLIAPFNYPVLLGIGPMATAIAAGNAVVLKPSELNIATDALVAELFPKYLDPDMFAIVNGSIKETQKLLELRWDHIMFTGSPKVGKIVAEAAAKHLTPTTLELGGKSPVFIDGSAKGKNLKLAARRLAWGRFMNCGQTCVAPDYILVPRDCQAEFIKEIKNALESMYPSSQGGPRQSESYGRIISIGQLDRIKRLLDGTKGKIVAGGESDREERFLAPTIVSDCDGADSLMSEEIFGPVLPIVPVDSVEEALAFVNAREHPLSVMVFSNDDNFKQYVADHTQSGSIMANECLFQAACEGLPFGGVGQSGYGNHVGKYGFETFTYSRASMDSPAWLDMKILYGSRYPPFRKEDLGTIKLIWGEGYVPYPRIGQSPSLRMRMAKVPWIKLLTIAVGAWAIKTQWWDLQPEGWVNAWLSGYWVQKLRMGWK